MTSLLNVRIILRRRETISCSTDRHCLSLAVAMIVREPYAAQPRTQRRQRRQLGLCRIQPSTTLVLLNISVSRAAYQQPLRCRLLTAAVLPQWSVPAWRRRPWLPRKPPATSLMIRSIRPLPLWSGSNQFLEAAAVRQLSASSHRQREAARERSEFSSVISLCSTLVVSRAGAPCQRREATH